MLKRLWNKARGRMWEPFKSAANSYDVRFKRTGRVIATGLTKAKAKQACDDLNNGCK